MKTIAAILITALLTGCAPQLVQRTTTTTSATSMGTETVQTVEAAPSDLAVASTFFQGLAAAGILVLGIAGILGKLQ